MPPLSEQAAADERATLRARHSKGTSLLTADFSNPIVAAARPQLIEARMTILDRWHVPRLPRLSVTLLTLLGILPLTLAHARPPYHTWLAGVYHQADFRSR